MVTKNMNYTEDNTACKLDTPESSNDAIKNDTTNGNSLAEQLLAKFVSRDDRVGQAVEPISVKVAGTDDILKRLEKHLSGELRIGLYDLLPDGRAQWAVVEFEDHSDVVADEEDDCLADAMKYQRRLLDAGMPSLLERSKNLNGRCYHLHIRFDEPVSARLLRDGLRNLGKQLFGTFKNEVFPKGDTGIGNFVWLPLFGGAEDVIHTKSGESRRGGGVPSGRTVLLDETGAVYADQHSVLAAWPAASARLFAEMAVPSVQAVSQIGTGIELNQPGLEKMEANCPLVRQWIEHPAGWCYDHWLGLGSNYIVFKGGWDRFVELSKQDSANFSLHEIDRIYDEVLAFHGPQTYEKFRDQGLDVDLPANSPKAPAGWGSWNDSSHDTIQEENGVYVKFNKFGGKEALSTFLIDPQELLRLPDGDVLTGNVHSTLGYTYEHVRIENSDWYNRSKLMSTIGHSDCTLHGSDVDTIDICRHVIAKVPVRKQGTRKLGLHDNLWVLRGSNINAAGYVEPLQLVPYDRSPESLHTNIQYHHLDDADYRTLATAFFANILNVNLPRVIQPILGWFFAAPLKDRIQAIDGSFPLLMCYGTKGGGKTTLLEKLLAFQGYTDPTPHSCTTKSFPLLHLMSSTNAVPVFLDEYKDDMKLDEKANIKRFMRKAYRGEVEEKGNPDKTVTAYYLEAPLIVCGELKITEAAILDRVIIGGFNDVITDRQDMQQAFASVNALDANGFMDRYVMFCLGVDVPERLQAAKDLTRSLLGNLTVGPRVFVNLAVMIFGLQLMINYAMQWGMDLRKQIDFGGVIASQIQEISGTGTGKVKNAGDILLEQMAMMIEKDALPEGLAWTFARPKQSTKKLLCIHLPSAAAEVTAYKQRMHADFEVGDEAAYRKHFENAGYVVEMQVGVKFTTDTNGIKTERTKRAVLIDYERALALGLDIIGFRSDADLQKLPVSDDDAEFALTGE